MPGSLLNNLNAIHSSISETACGTASHERLLWRLFLILSKQTSSILASRDSWFNIFAASFNNLRPCSQTSTWRWSVPWWKETYLTSFCYHWSNLHGFPIIIFIVRYKKFATVKRCNSHKSHHVEFTRCRVWPSSAPPIEWSDRHGIGCSDNDVNQALS
jgi:hypothetical protein